MKLILKTVLFASAAALVSAVPAFADTLSFTLSTPTVSVAPGGSYSFVGTLTAPSSNVAAIYLNGDDFTVDSGATVDDSAFLNSPLLLLPGVSYTGNLFSVTLSGSAAGSYLGSFGILGGGDASTYNVLANDSFQVNATTVSAATPEPGSWTLLTTGLGVVAMLRRRYSTR